MPDNDTFTGVLDEVQNKAFKALVSKGIHALLFPMKEDDDGNIVCDISLNLLKGYPVGGFSGSGDTADSEEFQDQLMGGAYKNFVPGAVDPGDISFNTYFTPGKAKPNLATVKNSMVFTPQFMLALATETNDPETLQGFFAAGVNYQSGSDLKGDYGKIIGSSLKFKITGEPKWGFAEVGTIAKTLYDETGNNSTTSEGDE